MDGSQKRTHVATGSTPHKPADKKSREADTSSHSPARRKLGFGERASPLIYRRYKSFFSLLVIQCKCKVGLYVPQAKFLLSENKTCQMNRHEYWNKAAAFVQETTGTESRRSGESNSSYLLLIYVLHPRQNYDLAFFPNLFGNFLEFFKFC